VQRPFERGRAGPGFERGVASGRGGHAAQEDVPIGAGLAPVEHVILNAGVDAADARVRPHQGAVSMTPYGALPPDVARHGSGGLAPRALESPAPRSPSAAPAMTRI
jgi:hypothetical protein